MGPSEPLHTTPKAVPTLGVSKAALNTFSFNDVDNFSFTNGDTYIDVDGAYGAQCWDLWQQYSCQLVGACNVSTAYGPHPGYAIALWDGYSQNGAATYYDQIPATAKAQKGDVAIWQYGSTVAPTSHVAIVLDDNGPDWLLIFSQNSSSSRPDNPYPGLSTGPSVTQAFTKAGLAGYLRPKAITGDLINREGSQGYGRVWQDHFWGTQSNGSLRHWWWDGASASIKAETWATNAVGQPATIKWGNQDHAFYRDTSGNLTHQFWTASTGIVTSTYMTGIAYDPAAIVANTGKQHIFAVDTSNQLQHTWYDPYAGTLTNEVYTTGVVGRPTLTYFNDEQHVFIRTTGNQILHHWFTPATGHNEELLPSSNIVGDPISARIPGSTHIFAVDSTGVLKHFWNTGSGWLTQDYTTGVTGRPTYFYVNSTQQVFIQSRGGDLIAASWDPVNAHVVQDWGSPVGTAPSCQRINNKVHVWSIDSTDTAQHWKYDPGSPYARDTWGQ